MTLLLLALAAQDGVSIWASVILLIVMLIVTTAIVIYFRRQDAKNGNGNHTKR